MRKDWYKEAFIYHLYPLGLLGAESSIDKNRAETPRITSLFDWIDYWKDLHINTLYFGPVFKSTSHGYDTIDYYNIDPRLGDNKSFSNLVRELNKNGIKTILDGVFHHVSRDFHQFQDVLKHKQNSMFCSWFYLDFNKKSPYGDPFYYEGWEGHYNLVKLNLKNPYVKEYLFNAVRKWITEFHISGLRLDVAYSLDEDFIKELRNVCLELKSDFWIMGEIIHGDYRRLLKNDMLHSTTNYECYKGIYSSHNDYNYFEISHSLNRLFGKEGIYKEYNLYNFVDNHDVNRIASILNNKDHLYLTYILLMTISGIPSIYYGSELGFEGSKINGNDSQLRPYLDFNHVQKSIKDNNLFNHIKNLSNIRVNSKALKLGDFEVIFTSNKQFVFSRSYENETYIIMLNMENKISEITLNNIKKHGTYIDLLNNNEKIVIDQNNKKVSINSNWGRILKL